jgi:hypothetical protein
LMFFTGVATVEAGIFVGQLFPGCHGSALFLLYIIYI